MGEKRVLLKDIAEASGLTINTVSRALKNKSDISLATRQRIQELAIDMGYIPDVVASSLRIGKTNTIGIMFDNIANPYYMIMTDLLHQRLKEDGYDMMVFTSSGENAKFDVESFNKMVARRIDGIITFLKPTPDVVAQVKQNNIPLVILGREGDDIGIDSVYTNDLLGGYEVGKYLYSKGHKKIGYIGAPIDIVCSKKRAEGLCKYMSEVDEIEDHSMIKYLKHGEMSLLEPINSLLSAKATAIFCFNDTMAYEVITILRKKNIRVPEDISVVGYDNIEDYWRVPVGLTSVECSKTELADQSIKTLMKRINKEQVSLVKIVAGTKIVIRQTA